LLHLDAEIEAQDVDRELASRPAGQQRNDEAEQPVEAEFL